MPDKVIEQNPQKRDREKIVGYFELIRTNPNFRWLWAGQVVSLLGDWFNIIASAILIRNLTDSGLALGLLFTIRMLAPFCVAPIAGIFADRYNRKHILIITDIVRGLLLIGLIFLKSTQKSVSINGLSIRGYENAKKCQLICPQYVKNIPYFQYKIE